MKFENYYQVGIDVDVSDKNEAILITRQIESELKSLIDKYKHANMYAEYRLLEGYTTEAREIIGYVAKCECGNIIIADINAEQEKYYGCGIYYKYVSCPKCGSEVYVRDAMK